MNEEQFRDVQGYENIYQVSNFGTVISKKFNKQKILKPSNDGYGYPFVALCKNGRMKLIKVHRLVAKAFIPNPENKPQVNHKDGIKTNNFFLNLEWVTCSENINHAYKNKLIVISKGEKSHMAKLSNNDTIEIKRLANSFTQIQLSEMFSCSQSNISLILNNKSRENQNA